MEVDIVTSTADFNGHPVEELSVAGQSVYSLQALQAELPFVDEDQVLLSELLSRVVQAVYAEMTEFAETMPSMSDTARKRTIADFCVKTKKQIAKLYAVMRWSRDADVVQKCMNITAFIMNQSRELVEIVGHLRSIKDRLAPAQLRNHDLLSSLDILTTGSYRRLPSIIKGEIIGSDPLNDEQVQKMRLDFNGLIRYRLRVLEPLPVEMSQNQIIDGQVSFTVPRLFQLSLSLRGSNHDDGWYFLRVVFLFRIGGESVVLSEFPRQPSGSLKTFIEDEANALLSFHLPLAHGAPEEAEKAPQKLKLPTGTVDAPLVRLYNFLQIMSLSYQLEVLCHQAYRLRALGWADCLIVDMAKNRKALQVHYWVRKASKPQFFSLQRQLPTTGGSVILSLVHVDPKPPDHASSIVEVLAALDRRSRMGPKQRISDAVEKLALRVEWQPSSGALGVNLPKLEVDGQPIQQVDPDNLNFEEVLYRAIQYHSLSILRSFRLSLIGNSTTTPFSHADILLKTEEGPGCALLIRLTSEETIQLTVDSRTGKVVLQGLGSIPTHRSHFTVAADRINESPSGLVDAVMQLRYIIVLEAVERKALYLGLRCARRLNMRPQELLQLGHQSRFLFVHLPAFPGHYLTIVVTQNGLKYALIALAHLNSSQNSVSVMQDIGWIEASKILSVGSKTISIGHEDAANGDLSEPSFDLSIRFLKELYTYCCARVAHMKVEQQLKEQGFSYTHVLPQRFINRMNGYTPSSHLVPALCIKSREILSGAQAAEAAEENVRVIPLSSWGRHKTQVLTVVKLKHVQPTVGRATISSKRIIRPSGSIMYDTIEGIVSVLSPNVRDCVPHFLSEWSKVAKMVIIARAVGQMAEQTSLGGIALLAFDLQNIEFSYAEEYALAITCQSDPNVKPSYSLRFFCCDMQSSQGPLQIADTSISSTPASEDSASKTNPHQDMVEWATRMLESNGLACSIRDLIRLLRLSLPILLELEECRSRSNRTDPVFDWFAKGMAWWRLSFDDSRGGLDIRIRSDNLLEISDCVPAKRNDLSSGAALHKRAATIVPRPKFSSICRDLCAIFPGRIIAVDSGVLLPSLTPPALTRSVLNHIITQITIKNASATR